MSASAVWALQRQIISTLRADAALQSVLGSPVPVYDSVPGDAILPYLSVGDWQYTDAGTDDGQGTRHQFTIEVWSDYSGRKQLLDVALNTEAAMAGLSMALDGHRLVDLRNTSGRFVRQESERLSLGLMRFTAFSQPTL